MNWNRWTTMAIVEKLERDGYLLSKRESDQADNTGSVSVKIAIDDKLSPGI